jgi:class 3 adenylate cyclase
MTRSRPEPSVGTEIAGYRVEGLLGEGGTGVVYLAEHLHLGRKAALKLLSPDLARDDSFRTRFLREARLAASLDHPHVVPVYDAGEADGLLFIAMRYVEGTDLEAVLASEGPLDPSRALRILGDVADALDAAHAHGLVHRDVKPGNVLIAGADEQEHEEHIYLGDFGVTKATRETSVTQAGLFVGTADYSAPEQIAGASVDARTDVYALGCVLHECLTGEPPFRRDGLVATLWSHVHDPPPAPSRSRAALPPALDDVVAKALAKEPADRYESCGELVEDARRALGVSGAVLQAGRASELPPGTVTFLFTDLEGSTQLLRRLGDAYAEVISEHRGLVESVVARHEGRVVDTQGDAFFVAFARAKDAVATALELQRAHAERRWPDGVRVPVRMGLHSGEPSIAEGGYVGLAVHRAARISGEARGGQILLSTATRELLEEALPTGLELRDLGEHRLKDFDRPERIFELASEGMAEPTIDLAPLPAFRVLGPLEVHADGRALELGGAKPRALLTVLLLHLGEVVSTDHLIDELWGERPPKSAHHLLHVYVSRLRKSLAPVFAESLVSRPPGYVLEIDPDELDARRFERLLGEGRRLLAAEDADAAADRLRTALELWRGPALADFTYEPFAQAEIARLEELRAVALEERIEADLALGRHQDVVGELETLVAAHPLRERPRGQLMLALYRGGRQAEALEVYREARRMLVDDLGIEPSPVLQQLQQAILRHDAALEVRAPRALAPPRERVPRLERAMRKLVTTVVASVPDAPELDGLDPEARRVLVSRTLETMVAVLERHGAVVDELAGETVIGVFGVPATNEDDSLRAVRAAWEARESVEGIGAELDRAWGVRVSSGFGVETGEALVEGDMSPRAVSGEAMARAVRLSKVARPGDVLLGEGTYRLIRHAVLAEETSGVPVQSGLAGSRRLLAVLAEAPTIARRIDSPFVGRELELGQLRQALERAVRDRVLRLVTVVGTAGVGKSRLAQEVLSSLPDRTITLVGRCLSHGEGITYWPLRDVAVQAAGGETREDVLQLLGDDDQRENIADRIMAVIGTADVAGDREATFWAFRRFFEAIARERPLVLVLEDLHWAEPTMLDLVEYLVDWTRDASLLVVCLARPELFDTRPSWSTGKSNAVVLTLEPLGDEESVALVDNLVSGAPLPKEARARIVETAEGNPLFLEQMLAMLAEEERSQGTIVLPTTIQAVLAARLDRLGPGERAVLECAAVPGREFWSEAVAALLPVGARASIPRHLEALVRKELVRASRSTLPGQEAFRFGHALIQEVAYRSVAKEQRAELHERLAGWLEGELGERIGEYEAIVGFHFEQAFRYREELRAVDGHARSLAWRASSRLASAGRRALAQVDPPSAANLLGRAASLVEESEPRRLELLADLVAALREVPDLQRAAVVAGEAVAGAAAAGDRRLEALARIERVHVGLMSARSGAVQEAFDEGEGALAVFRELDDDLGLAKAWRLIAMANRLLGRQSARREALEQALVHAQRSGDRRTEAWIYDGLGGVHNYGPSSVQALLAFAEMSLQWARANGQRFSEVHSLAQGLGRSYAMLGDFEAARRAVAEAKSIVEDLGFVWHRAGVASAAGFVEALAGDPVAAERELRAGYELVEESGMIGSYFGMALRDELAQALYTLGHYDEARGLSELSEELAPADDVQTQVQWRAVRAKVLSREGRAEEAEALARAAVTMVEQTEFLIVHANALLDLGEVLRLAHREDEAAIVVEEALALFERKGDRTSAVRARDVIAQLEASSPAPG